MYFQQEYLREAVAATRNDTYKLDLPDTGILSSLLLRLHGKPATGNPFASQNKWRLIDFIDKIEVILNGATICKSLTGMQAQYLAFMDQRVVAPTKWSEYSEPTLREYILINFGRWFGDTQYGLDLSRFASAELQITNSCDTTNWQDDLKWTILANWIREPAAAPLGYLRSETWRSWTTVADETKYLDLPTEHILRRIILQAIPNVDTNYLETTSLFDLMDDIELSLQTGVLRVYKGGLDDLLYLNALDLGVQPITGGWTYHNADYGFNVGLGYVDAMALAAGSKDDAGATAPVTVEGDRNSFTQKAESFETDTLIGFLAKGIGYHNCGYFRFDQDPNPASWLDPASRRTVQLNIHTADSSSAANGTNYVVLDRLVTY